MNKTDLTIPIYTVGYGNRTVEEFIALLASHQIQYLIDIRTSPYSRFKPEFNKQDLENALSSHDIRYLLMGDSLGGQPQSPACYTDGKVDYDKVKRQPLFLEGISRLQKAFTQQQKVVLMCSELRPEECHRSKLVGATLAEQDIPVLHIDEHGDLQTQEAVIARLTKGQLGLFGDPAFTSRKRYRKEEKADED
ncbi:MAG: DUF488 domain-containing protein [Chloroflexi bacterium]|nr:DUF488 domain-containing protein [Chloroflexota bacterium]